MKQPTRPVLIATLGFPGSGKTFFARRFAKEFGFAHLNSDRLRLTMFSRPVYRKAEHALLFGAMDYIAGGFLRAGIDVLYDANSTKRAYRRRLRKIARSHHAEFL